MPQPAWLRWGLIAGGAVIAGCCAWWLWTYIDWYGFSPAVPSERTMEIVDDPHTKLLTVSVDGVDVDQSEAVAVQGAEFLLSGRCDLDPRHWALRQSIDPRTRRPVPRPASLMRCLVQAEIVCKSWTFPGELRVKDISCSVKGEKSGEGRWSNGCTPIERPGRYLVRIFIAERKPWTDQWGPPNPIVNKRLLKTFVLQVEPR